jgi:hypothetical protein
MAFILESRAVCCAIVADTSSTAARFPKQWLSGVRQETFPERFEVLAVVTVKIAVFRDVTSCSLVYVYCCFEGKYCLLSLE